jgi:hypothetical protein
VAYEVSISVIASCHCIILHCTAFVDVTACWSRPNRYNIIRCLRRGAYDIASYLVGYGGSGHAYALYLHSEDYMH